MSDRAMQADIGDATLDADVARWSADPGLAPVFAAPGGMILVLDETGERVIRATSGAATLRAAITGTDGRVRAGLRFPDQLRSTGQPGAGARLIRVRFDSRGIARPTSCVVARAADTAGETILLLAPTEKLPALRVAAGALPPVVAVAEPLAGPAIEAPPAPFARIVWRSDREGVFIHVSGGPPEIAVHLVGRSLQALGESGVAAGPSLLAALDARQTFRALPLVVRPPGAGHEIEIAVSGAPSARPAKLFAGFSGFGVVRETRPLAEEAVDAPHAVEQPSAEPGLSSEPPGGEPMSAPAALAWHEPEASLAPKDDVLDSPASAEFASFGAVLDPAHAEEPESTDAEIEQGEPHIVPLAFRAADDHADDAEPAPEPAAPAPRGADLSTHEHAAFREIARALGARFAGDDEPTPSSQPSPDTERRGAVMTFPVSAAQSASAAIEAAIVSALDRLPAGVLVHRDAEILYVNRRFLDLTDYPDRKALTAAGALAHLLGRLPSQDEGPAPDTPVTVTTGTGALLSLLVERSKVDWDAGPAELLLVHPAEQADRARERIARGLLEARETVRERDAQDLLDHIEEGIATLDESGRVLALNGSAKTILASDAREIVGGTLADLFTPESEPVVAASLREARERGTSEPRDASPRAGGRSDPLRLRIAKLSAVNTARFCVTLREQGARAPAEPRRFEPENLRRADFLDRVSDEIRTPLNGILAHAEAMLSEKLGPLGSERYREYLREIHHSGEHVLGVVDDLVDLARIEAGRSELTFTDIALNEVVSGCIALMQPQAVRDRIVVRTSLSPDLRPLLADERSMRQATLNVIANAIRLTEAGGQVIVSTTTAERGEIAFRVRDTGIGMTQEEIENALEPFRRGEGAGGRNGTGLGLTLTKALVEANRGRFRITSRKNEGTLVEMLFPPPQALSA